MNPTRTRALVVRRWIILAAVATNIVLGILVWLTLTVSGERRVITAALAVVPMLPLMLPLLGISFWARDRGTHRLSQWVASLPPRVPTRARARGEPDATGRLPADQSTLTGHR